MRVCEVDKDSLLYKLLGLKLGRYLLSEHDFAVARCASSIANRTMRFGSAITALRLLIVETFAEC